VNESWREFNEQLVQQRKEKLEKVMVLAKRLCPVDYKKLVHAIFL